MTRFSDFSENLFTTYKKCGLHIIFLKHHEALRYLEEAEMKHAVGRHDFFLLATNDNNETLEYFSGNNTWIKMIAAFKNIAVMSNMAKEGNIINVLHA